MKERADTMESSSIPVVRCGGCQRTLALDTWLASPAMVTLTASEVRGYVSAWPAGAVIEVRACGGCGRAIARRREGPCAPGVHRVTSS